MTIQDVKDRLRKSVSGEVKPRIVWCEFDQTDLQRVFPETSCEIIHMEELYDEEQKLVRQYCKIGGGIFRIDYWLNSWEYDDSYEVKEVYVNGYKQVPIFSEKT